MKLASCYHIKKRRLAPDKSSSSNCYYNSCRFSFKAALATSCKLFAFAFVLLLVLADLELQVEQQQQQQIANHHAQAELCELQEVQDVGGGNACCAQEQQQHNVRLFALRRQNSSDIKWAAATEATEAGEEETSKQRKEKQQQQQQQQQQRKEKLKTAANWLLNSLVLFAQANSDANRLYEDLMMTYNRIVRPVQNNSDRVVVKLSLKLSQLIDVNLKNQMMTTNVWLNQEWDDYKLKWDPSEYGGIEDINVPAEQIWLPDIVLYNSAEGYFAVSIMTKAKVRYDGHVTWNPPAIFRSSCQIDITYFPFDSQNCHLKFGSWTFGTKIDLKHIKDTEIIERGTDLSEYYQNVEWDIMQATARRNVITYICCPNDFYPDVTFNFKLRRKPLFYTVNLILPCVGITILSFLVFYLPSDSGEKVTLTISILVSLIFFLSVLIETIPSTSTAMPLLGKYLVFTMILITLSVCATVCVLNIHFRTPSTHSMSPWVKRWCIDILPRYLFMNVPQYQSQQANAAQVLLPEQLIYLHNQAYARQQQQQYKSACVDNPKATPTCQHASNGNNNSNFNETNWSSAEMAALYIKANHSADFKQQQQRNQFPHQLNPNLLKHEFSPAATADCCSVDITRSSSCVAKQKTHNNNISPSTTSVFLPYLQSEAARRLQMQRSRSSERDRSTSDQAAAAANNNPNTSKNCDTTINRPKSAASCSASGRQQTTIGMNQAEVGVASEGGGRGTGAGSSSKANKASSHKKTKRKCGQRSGRTSGSDDLKRGGLLTRLLGSFKSSKKQSRAENNGESEEHKSSNASSSSSSMSDNSNKRASRPTVRLQHDTSSSFENDYQYHNHFQARASVCSTNLWRVGPSRRCSVAQLNYPTYYQPMLQPNPIQQYEQQLRVQQESGGPLSSLSANVQARQAQLYRQQQQHQQHHHHHHHHQFDDNEKSTIGAMVQASVSTLGYRTPALSNPALSDNTLKAQAQQQQQQLIGASSSGQQAQRQLNYSTLIQRTVQQQQQQQQQVATLNRSADCSSSLMPTPPLPPPEGSSAPLFEQLKARQQQQSRLLQMPMGVALLQSPARTATKPFYLQQQQQQQQHKSRLVGQRLSPLDFGANFKPTAHEDTQQSGQLNSSTTDPLTSAFQTHATLSAAAAAAAAEAVSPNRQQQQQYQRMFTANLRSAGSANLHRSSHSSTTTTTTTNTTNTNTNAQNSHLEQQQQQQMPMAQLSAPSLVMQMSRSRSTDHRLCQHAQANFYLAPTSSVNGAGGVTSQQQQQQQKQMRQNSVSLQHSNCGAVVNVAQAAPNLLANVGSSQAAQAQTIGRALGQAYMQRLQRQPTIYSLQSNIHRPSAAYLTPLNNNNSADHQHQQQQHSTCDWMRRSKSQTSLDQRRHQHQHQQHHALFDGACSRCGISQPITMAAASRPPTAAAAAAAASSTSDCCNSNCRQIALCSRAGVNQQQPQKQQQQQQPAPLTQLGLIRLISDVDKAIQNAMFIAQHIDNLDEFESVKENWKYIAMVIDRIFLIVFLFACIAGTVTIFAMVPWSYYITEKPIDLQLTRLMALNLTGNEPYSRSCRDF